MVWFGWQAIQNFPLKMENTEAPTTPLMDLQQLLFLDPATQSGADAIGGFPFSWTHPCFAFPDLPDTPVWDWATLPPVDVGEFLNLKVEEDPSPSPAGPSRGGFSKKAATRKEAKIPCSFPDCARMFAYPSLMQEHLRTHTKERPFVCDFDGCDKTYTTKNRSAPSFPSLQFEA
ncbi:hypothetical protein BC830DRAFT_1140091, partial [Chytriomyces sp. MP71]